MLRRFEPVGRGACARLACGVVAFLNAPPAFAQDHASVRLQYSRDEHAARCAGERATREAVAARLGYDPFVDDAARVVVVELRHDAGGPRATVSLRDRAGAVLGARDLRSPGPGCDELSASVALAISLAIDPVGGARAAPSDGDAAASGPATLEHAPPPAMPAGAEPPASSGIDAASPRASTATPDQAPRASGERGRVGPGWSPIVSLGVAAGEGGARVSASPGAWAGVGMASRRAALSVEGRAAFPSSRDVERGATLTSSFVGAALLPCARLADLDLCAVVLAGELRGASSGIASPERKSTAFAAAGPRVTYALALERGVSLVAWAELDVTLTRTTFLFRDGPVWSSGAAAGIFGAGARVCWP